MTEKEFELFCRHKLKKPDFVLGRKVKKEVLAEEFHAEILPLNAE
jgi:hypothetical protein